MDQSHKGVFQQVILTSTKLNYDSQNSTYIYCGLVNALI